MPEARAASVRPRVHSPFSGEVVLLEDLVRDLGAEGWAGTLLVSGPPGWGKRTAAAHLEAVLEGDADPLVRFVELREGESIESPYEAPLAPWSWDEALEYLQARHPEPRTSVLVRLRANGDVALLDGCPELWVIVLDLLAADASVASAAEALRIHMERHPLEPEIARDLARWRLASGRDGLHLPGEVRGAWLASVREDPSLAHDATQRAWLALQVSRAIERGDAALLAGARVPQAKILRLIAVYLDPGTATTASLRELIAETSSAPPALAASLLHARDPAWLTRHLAERAAAEVPPDLDGAELPGFAGHGLELPGLRLPRANLRKADLRRANLSRMEATAARFTGADLAGADLTHLRGESATFRRCGLRKADLEHAALTCADLRGAELESARLSHAVLEDADLRGIRARASNWTGAILRDALLEGADLTDACLDYALLTSVDLRQTWLSGATLRHARLDHARLAGADLRGLELAGAKLRSADLTGARLAGARLVGASLGGARMAHVDLEGADLRDANLTRADFHLGSSRSGLVFSPYASEGTRTGFYTEDDTPQDFRAPEEIRKANLRGADLRDAVVEDTDFYLVDLRDVRCSERQRAHFRRCRAILE